MITFSCYLVTDGITFAKNASNIFYLMHPTENSHTKVIIIRVNEYSDSLLILKTIDDEGIIKSFVFRKSKNKKKQQGILYPSSRVLLTPQRKSVGKLPTIKEISSLQETLEFYFNPIKQSILFFCCEVIDTLFKEGFRSKSLFLLFNTIKQKVETENVEMLSSIPLFFISRMTDILGISLTKEEVTKVSERSTQKISEEQIVQLLKITELESETYETFKKRVTLSVKARRELLLFYISYIETLYSVRKKIKSHLIFAQILE